MILGFYGRKTRVSECAKYSGGGRDGVTAEKIAESAERFGLKVKAYSLTIEQLVGITLPVIIHWRFNHFVVLENWSPTKVIIVDPATGRVRVSPEEFDASFTGVVLTFEPGDRFEKKTEGSKTTWKYYLTNIFGIKASLRILSQILIASMLLQVLGLILPAFTMILVDHVLALQMRDLLLMLGLGLFILILSHMVIQYLRGALLVYLQGKIDSRMMVSFFEHVLALPYQFFQKRLSGDLLMRLSSNITIREIITNQTLSLVLDSLFVIVYLAIILFKAPLFAALVLTLGMLQVAVLLGSARRIRQLMQNDLAASAETQSYLIEILKGIATLKASGGEDRALKTWTKKFYKELKISLERHHIMAIIDTSLNTIRLASPLALLWAGGFMVLNDMLSLGTMLALQALGIAFLTPLGSMIETGQQWQFVGAYLDRVEDVVEAETEQSSLRTIQAPILKGGIEVKNLGFRYGPYSPYVLKDISFVIEPRQKLALVGRSGAGKSTLAHLLLGLYQPTSGEIFYDQVPISRLDLASLRRQFGAVLQESFAFHGSIRQNIAFNKPDLSLDEIVAAAKIAGIHDEIIAMPMGYETLIAEGGSGLSGGQLQRLAIARAVAHRPALLVLDESTSHLDSVTENIVDRNLSSELGTRIVIAHRLSTIKNADLTLVLKDGRIEERGRHDELLSKGGYYRELVKGQVLSDNPIG
jgi:ABC-type bacteriocin/lantibiotic exporter with double-glycine peptidase domain